MKKLGAAFYLILAVLTVAELGTLFAWIYTKRDVLLYIALGVFPVYLFHLIFHLVRAGKREARKAELKSAFVSLLREQTAEIVYLTYLGGEKRLEKPSAGRKDYLVEFYTEKTDRELLKRHLWFDLSPERESELALTRLGGMKIPYPLLGEIAGKMLFVSAGFYQAAEHNPAFKDLLCGNTVVLYGE